MKLWTRRIAFRIMAAVSRGPLMRVRLFSSTFARWCRTRRLWRTLLAAMLPLAVFTGPASAIVGGDPSSDPEGARRFTVGVIGRSGDICTGIVVSRRQILTAAHCPARSPAQAVVALDPEFRPRLFRAARTWRDPGYRPKQRAIQQKGADVGLVTLAIPLPEDMRPIPIADDLGLFAKAARVRIAGFGVAEPGRIETAGVLREAPLRVIGLGLTGRLHLFASASGQFGGSDQSPCHGDSGGPVIAEQPGVGPVLIGVISSVGGSDANVHCRGVTVATPTLLLADGDVDTLASVTQTLQRGGGMIATPPPVRAIGPDPAGNGR